MNTFPWRDYQEFMKDAFKVYKASTLELLNTVLDKLEGEWGKASCKLLIKSWRTNNHGLSNCFQLS